MRLPGQKIITKKAICNRCQFLSIQRHVEGDRILIILYQSNGNIGSRLKTANHILIVVNIIRNVSTRSHAWSTSYALGSPITLPYIIMIIPHKVARIRFDNGHAIATRKSHFTGSRK